MTLPVKEYYGGSGTKVMKKMKEQYGEEKGKRVFYATAAKKKSLKERVKEHAKDKD